jgi:hypothetical protein
VRFVLVIAALIACAACSSVPVSSVRSVDTRPSISVSRVNEYAELYVDGLRMGMAWSFEEPNQLKLDPGTHRVSIVEAGKVTFEQTIFVESEHKTINAR